MPRPARLFLGTASFLCLTAALRADSALADVYARSPVSLNGKWNAIVDPDDSGYYDYRHEPLDASPDPKSGYFLDRKPKDKSDFLEYDFDRSPTLNVPGDWNSQRERLFYYDGAIWYRRLFDAPKSGTADRLFLYFGAANYESEVYLNGKLLGKHVGGFTPFSYEITALARASGNSLVVRVDNRRRPGGVPGLDSDWWNYGGLTRDVLLVETPPTFIREFRLQLKKGSTDRLEARVQLDGADKRQKITVAVPDANLSASAQTDDSGEARFEIPAAGLTLWSPENPRLYAVGVSSESDRLTDKIGFRTIETRGSDILLNGRPIFLRGVCIHEENPKRGGRASSVEDDRLLLGWAKELNCNFVRLAHYPHNEQMLRLADELGLMVWEEIPVYWTLQWENPDTLKNARSQLADAIARDQNRASVVVWSVGNETRVSEPRTRFLRTLAGDARSLDGTRLVSAAMEIHADPKDADHRIMDDPFAEFADLLSFNEYIGWYGSLPADSARVTWSIKGEKPIVVTEMGGEALQGFHADKLTRFSEEYQEDLYRQNLAMLSKLPHFRGLSPWVLCDFRSPRRNLPNVQDGWNRKGLIGETGGKKKAFFVLRAFYDDMAAQPAP